MRLAGPSGQLCLLGILVAPASADASSRSVARPRILIVDDDPDILETLAAIIEAMLGVPAEVTQAASGEDARRFLERGGKVDLVLTDERMPGMRGTELLVWMKDRGVPARRVLMSAFVQGQGANDLAQSAGAEAFIPKPIRLEVLLPQLRKMLKV